MPPNATAKAKKITARIDGRVPAHLRARLNGFAEQSGVKPAAILRALLERLPETAEEAAARSAAEATHSTADSSNTANRTAPTAAQKRRQRFQPKTVQINLRLSADENEVLTAVAGQYRVNRPAYIVAVLRTALQRQPQFIDEEIKAVYSASRVLNGIGTNLNQIARRLNERPGPPDHLDAELVRLEHAVRTQSAAFTQLVNAAVSRWS